MAEVFISYSRKDSKWVDQLRHFLTPLLRKENATVWTDEAIKPGQNWREEIEKSLVNAKIAILLISPAYLASVWVTHHELPLLLERVSAGELVVIPVITSPVYSLPASLKNIQFLNISEPLDSLSKTRQEEVLIKLVRTIQDYLPCKSKNNGEAKEELQDKYSRALDAAILKIGGDNMNILGQRNIFFEAEEKMIS